MILNEGLLGYHTGMSEAGLWAKIKRGFPGRIQRIEVKFPLGFPDTIWHLGGITGLMELKYEETHVRAEQAIFLRNWSTDGVIALLLAQRKGEFFLMHGNMVPLNRKIPYEQAFWVGTTINGKILSNELSKLVACK